MLDIKFECFWIFPCFWEMIYLINDVFISALFILFYLSNILQGCYNIPDT